jgi:acetyltransferase-like isoleucine patch superfamily enzyme
MIHKFLIFYSWIIRVVTFCLPDIPIIMRFRGSLYFIFNKNNYTNIQVAHSVVIVGLENFDMQSNTYIANGCVIIANGRIILGKNTIIGPNTTLVSSEHIWSEDSYRNAKSKPTEIFIENGCWIGANCVCIGGSLLPKGSILAAGGVLNKKHTEINSIYAGTPAIFKKKIR